MHQVDNQKMEHTQMELQVTHFEGIAPAVFGEAAAKICHGIDELIRDVE